MSTRTRLVFILSGILTTFDETLWAPLFHMEGIEKEYLISTWEETPLHEGIRRLPYTFLEYEKESDIRPLIQQKAAQFLIKPEETKVENTLFMWHKWGRLASHLDRYSEDTLVIRVRFDIDFSQESMASLLKEVRAFQDQTAYDLSIPSGGNHRGGLPDILALGKVKAMKTYLQLGSDCAAYYQDEHFFHPEWMLRYHLVNQHHYRIHRFPFRLFIRGVVYNKDSFDCVTDTQKACVSKKFKRRQVPHVPLNFLNGDLSLRRRWRRWLKGWWSAAPY